MCSIPPAFNRGVFEWTVHEGEIIDGKINTAREKVARCIDDVAGNCTKRRVCSNMQAALNPLLQGIQKKLRRKTFERPAPRDGRLRISLVLIIHCTRTELLSSRL
jgi:hypothetical protein